MAKVWNPGARRDMVGMFLNAWCIREPSAWIPADSLFGAYEVFCRHHRRKDLTFGEFADQMEIEGCQMQQRYGAGVFNGLSLTYMEDAFISRHYGARPGKS